MKEQKIRKEIMRFAQEMEKIMSKHDKIKSDSWNDCSIRYLFDKLEEEWEEASIAFFNEVDYPKTRKELIDLSNICMMLWHRLKG